MALYQIVNGKKVQMSEREEAEIKAFGAKNKVAQEAIQYKDDRQREMPSIGEQLEDLWKAMDSGKLPNDNDFYLKRKAIYDKYPAPVE